MHTKKSQNPSYLKPTLIKRKDSVAFFIKNMLQKLNNNCTIVNLACGLEIIPYAVEELYSGNDVDYIEVDKDFMQIKHEALSQLSSDLNWDSHLILNKTELQQFIDKMELQQIIDKMELQQIIDEPELQQIMSNILQQIMSKTSQEFLDIESLKKLINKRVQEMIGNKSSQNAQLRTTKQLIRYQCDLSNESERKNLYAFINAYQKKRNKENIIFITEGYLMYLETSSVQSLAIELSNIHGEKYWISDSITNNYHEIRSNSVNGLFRNFSFFSPGNHIDDKKDFIPFELLSYVELDDEYIEDFPYNHGYSVFLRKSLKYCMVPKNQIK